MADALSHDYKPAEVKMPIETSALRRRLVFLCLEPRLAVQLIQFVTNSDYETSRFFCVSAVRVPMISSETNATARYGSP